MLQAIPKTRFRRLELIQWVAKGNTTLDILKSYKGDRPIASIRLRFAFQIQATGGGTVSGLAQDASVQLMAKRMQLTLAHKELGQIEPVNASQPNLCQLWHLMNDITGKEQRFTDPAPTVGATLAGKREFTIRFDSPYAVRRFGSYVDPRDLSSMQLLLEFPDFTVYATTNLNAVLNATIAVDIEEIIEGIPQGGAYFIPLYKFINQSLGSQVQTDLVAQGIRTGGYVPLFSMSPHVDAAVGNAQRDTAGLVTRVSVSDSLHDYVDKTPWTELAEETEKDFPLGFTTTRRTGPVTVLCDRGRNFMSMANNKDLDLSPILDTQNPPQIDVTQTNPTTNDRLDFLFVALKPNLKMLGAMKKVGIAS